MLRIAEYAKRWLIWARSGVNIDVKQLLEQGLSSDMARRLAQRLNQRLAIFLTESKSMYESKSISESKSLSLNGLYGLYMLSADLV